MALSKWEDLTATPEYQGMSPEQQEGVRTRYTAMGGTLPAAPQGESPGVLDYASVGLRGLAKVPGAVAANIASAVQGQAGVEAPGQGDIFEEKLIRPVSKGLRSFEQDVAQKFPGSTGIQTLSRLPAGISFSLPSMATGVAAGVAAAPLAAVPGGQAAPFIAGGTGAGTYAYRSSSAEIMRSYIDTLDEEKRAKSGAGLTEAEADAARRKFSTKAAQVGLWEAVPEAVGGAVAGRLILGPIKKAVGEKLAVSMADKLGIRTGKQALRKLGAAAGVAGEELATETITQVGQSRTLAGTKLAGDEPPLEWNAKGMLQAFREIAPDTLMLTAAMGGGMKAGQGLYRRRKEGKLATDLGIDRTELKDRVGELLEAKQLNPDLDLSSPEATQYLAGAVTLKDSRFAPATEEVESEDDKAFARLAESKKRAEEEKGAVQQKVHDYSNTQIKVPKKAADKIKALSKAIPDTELYTDPKDPSYGRETEPHVTVRYGLETDSPKDVASLSELPPITAKLGKVSIFEADKYDVVKVEVDSDSLRAANKKVGAIAKLPGETFKDYQPHATIAYVKKGEGKKYIGNKSLEGQEIQVDSIDLTDRKGKTHTIKLQGEKVESKAQTETKAAKEKAETEGLREAEKFTVAVVGKNNDIKVTGDPEAIHAKLKEAGHKFTGRATKTGRIFSKARREKIEETFPQETTPQPEEPKFSIAANKARQLYHGSGTSGITKFDLAKAGSNDGTAYGHGIYLTDSADVARYYAENESGQRDMAGNVPKRKPGTRNIYKAGVKGKNFVSWTKITPKQKKQLVSHSKNVRPEYADMIGMLADMNNDGGTVYRDVAGILGSEEAASKFFLDAGIDGIKVPVGLMTGGKQKGENYVVFDPEAIKITDSILYSKKKGKAGTGSTEQKVRAEIGEKTISALEEKGLLRMATEAEARKFIKDMPGKVEGFAFRGKIVLLPENIKEGQGKSVLLHEVGHVYLPKLFKGKQWDSLVKAFDKHTGKDTTTGKAVDAALARTEEAGTKVENRAEEAIMYYLSETANQKQGLYRQIMAYIKKALVKMGVSAEILTPADVRAIVEGYIATVAKGGDTQTAAVPQSVNEFAQPAKMSLKKATDKITDSAAFKKWFGDSKVVDANGEPLVVYHGTKRDFSTFKSNYADNLLFFTTNPEFAGNWIKGSGGFRDVSPETKKFVDAAYDIEKEIGNKNKKLKELDDNDPNWVAKYDEIRAEVRAEIKQETGFKSWTEHEAVADSRIMPVYLAIKNPFDPRKDYKKIETFLKSLPNDMDSIVNKGLHKAGNWVVYENEQVIKKLKSLGYDGIYLAENLDGPHETIAAFNPTQIKSIYNKGTFDETNPDIMYSRVSDTLKAGREKVENAVRTMKNPKAAGHNEVIQHASKWLNVTPLHTMTKLFGKDIPQAKTIPEELSRIVSAKNKLTDEAKDLYEKAETLAKKGAGVDALNKAIATASYYRMTPWESVENQEWANGGVKKAQKRWTKAKMQSSTGKSFSEGYSAAAKAYRDLKSPELQQAYKDMVAHIASIRVRERNNLLAFIEMATEKGSTEREEMMRRFNDSFSNLYGAYWPLARVGDWVLEYTDTKGRKIVQHRQSRAQRNALKAQLLTDGVNKKSIKEDFKSKKPSGAIALPAAFMDQLNKTVTDKYMQDVDTNDADAVAAAEEEASRVTKEMSQIWLRWQPETSSLKNSVQRKNVRGFDEDMLRSYLGYIQNHASGIAWSEHGRKIDEALESLAGDIREKKDTDEGPVNTDMMRHIHNDLQNRIHALKTVSVGSLASAFGKANTFWFMTSPSIALVQMSQLAVLTFPKLAVKYGVGAATKALAAGTKAAFTTRFTKDAMTSDPKVNKVYDNMYARVTDENRNTTQAKKRNEEGEEKQLGDPLYTHAEILKQIDKDLNEDQVKLLTLREATARNLLDISAAHEVGELVRGKDPKGVQSKAFKYAMMPMALSELASRKSTILGTLELAQKDGKNFYQSMNAIDEVVNDTLHSYAVENKPVWMQGGGARVIMQFQWYRIMTGLRMALLAKNMVDGKGPETRAEAAKELTGIMGMTGMLAGTLGLPLSEAIFAILNLVFGDEDEPYDSKLVFTNWLTEKFGETAGDVIAQGAPTLAGMNISRRIGLQDIYGFQQEPPPGMHGKALAAWWAASLLGPSFSVAQGVVQGYDEMMNKGNYAKGLEAAVPKPLRDALKAYRLHNEGLKTSQGKRLLSDEDIGIDEVLMVLMGFNADEIARAQSAEHSLRKISKQISERRGRLIRDAAKAILGGSYGDKAFSDIREFNRKMPRYMVKGGEIRSAVRKVIKGELGATGLRERTVAQQYEIPVYGVR